VMHIGSASWEESGLKSKFHQMFVNTFVPHDVPSLP
jgi:hypothetical protein